MTGTRAVEHALFLGLGSGLAAALMVVLSQASGQPLTAVPFATSIVLVMAAPDSPPARVRAILGGHLIATASGFVVLALFGSSPLLGALAIGIGTMLMLLTDTLHPPAGINGLIVVTIAPSWTYTVVPVLTGCLILIAFARFYHGLARPSAEPGGRPAPGGPVQTSGDGAARAREPS